MQRRSKPGFKTHFQASSISSRFLSCCFFGPRRQIKNAHKICPDAVIHPYFSMNNSVERVGGGGGKGVWGGVQNVFGGNSSFERLQDLGHQTAAASVSRLYATEATGAERVSESCSGGTRRGASVHVLACTRVRKTLI